MNNADKAKERFVAEGMGLKVIPPKRKKGSKLGKDNQKTEKRKENK